MTTDRLDAMRRVLLLESLLRSLDEIPSRSFTDEDRKEMTEVTARLATARRDAGLPEN